MELTFSRSELIHTSYVSFSYCTIKELMYIKALSVVLAKMGFMLLKICPHYLIFHHPIIPKVHIGPTLIAVSW